MNQISISSDSDSDASIFASSTTNTNTNRRTNPSQHLSTNHTPHPTTTTNTTQKIPIRKTTNHHTRETIHISNTILSSRELILLHSLAANESVPRTRRRFMAQLLEPDDPLAAARLVCDRPVIQLNSAEESGGGGAGAGSSSKAVGGLQLPKDYSVTTNNIIDVIETGDSNGWERLRVKKVASGGSPMARKTSSPGVGGSGSKRGQQQQQQKVVLSESRSASRSGSPLASPSIRRRRRREDGDGDVDMDIS